MWYVFYSSRRTHGSAPYFKLWIVLHDFAARFRLTVDCESFCGTASGSQCFLCDSWLIGDDMCLKRVHRRLIRNRRGSISGDHWEGLQKTLTSIFLKRGTFKVLNLNVCCFSQWMSVSLARDAYNAYSRRARGHQVQFFHWCNGGRKQGRVPVEIAEWKVMLFHFSTEWRVLQHPAVRRAHFTRCVTRN